MVLMFAGPASGRLPCHFPRTNRARKRRAALHNARMIDWEKRYQEGDTPWDKGAPHPALASVVADVPELRGRVLVPGCGLGYDMRALLDASAVEEVVGIDVADSAVAAARKNLAGCENLRVEKADLFALGRDHARAYDAVWEHTCFCAIDPARRNAYVNAVADALRLGGHLIGVFYLNPWDTEEENRTLGPPYACPLEELDRRFATRFEIVRVWDPPATFPGREGREQLRLLRRV